MTRYILLGFTILLFTARAHGSPDPDDLAGRVIGTLDGDQIELPLLKSGYRVNVEGDMATVEVTQTFENPSALPMNARYLFPLNQLAAVYGMEMRVGGEVIQAVIRERQQAEAEFQTAAQEGKAAALLTQHRPNMFTQDIANLMPGHPIEVRLRYVQMVPKIDRQYQLVIPMIVGPRYIGAPLPDEGQVAALDAEASVPAGTWQIADVPDYPGVAGLGLPETIAGDRVSLDVAFTSGFDVSDFGSMTHELSVTTSDTALKARFTDGQVLDNRDLVLRYTLAASDVQAGALSHTDDRGGYLSVMIEPPVVPDETRITPRELVFVLDTSGSMNGAPMAASKRFMSAALSGLRPRDYFRIIPFSNSAQQMSSTALPATAQNLANGARYVQNLSAAGGTEIDRAIRTAFATEPVKDTIRIVVFLSDGYIGSEHTVLKTIREQIGAARIYAFGVGSSVNRYLLDGMAEEGRGYARYVGLDEDALEVAETLARDLKSPLLTDITIDWGTLAVEKVSPARIPDLFAGSSVRVYARHRAGGDAEVKINGLVNGRPATLAVPVTLTEEAREPALPLIWARNRISMLERNVAVGISPQRSDDEITKLGLEYSLQTKNTSFVAVSQRVVNETGFPAATHDVPLPMVHGVGPTAYPQAFSGSSTPEPQAWLGMLMLAALSVIRLLSRRGRTALE